MDLPTRLNPPDGTQRTVARPRALPAPVGVLLGWFISDFSVDSDQLTSALLEAAKRGAATHLLEHPEIRELASKCAAS